MSPEFPALGVPVWRLALLYGLVFQQVCGMEIGIYGKWFIKKWKL